VGILKCKTMADYFKLDKNESGKLFLFYKPSKYEYGRYSCWLPIDDEFYNEFSKLLSEKRQSYDFTEGYKKGWSDCYKDVKENP